jgi:hypothetical protein
MITQHDPINLPCSHREPPRQRVHRRSGAKGSLGVVLALFLLAEAAIAPRPAHADLTYSLVNYPAEQGGHTLSGNITTDGTIGVLSTGDIVAWSVTIDESTFTSTDPLAGPLVVGDQLVASANAITLFGATQERPSLFLEAAPNILEWDQTDTFGADSDYSAVVGGNTVWDTPGATLGSSDTWTIATRGAAVPEPSTAVLAGIAAGGLTAGVLVRRTRKQRHQDAASQSLSAQTLPSVELADPKTRH